MLCSPAAVQHNVSPHVPVCAAGVCVCLGGGGGVIYIYIYTYSVHAK